MTKFEGHTIISTVSIGVLKNEIIEFSPPLPDWKVEAIDQFDMAIYNKVFVKFKDSFWDRDKATILIKTQHKGRFCCWKTVEDSKILWTSLIGPEAVRIEQQDESETKKEI